MRNTLIINLLMIGMASFCQAAVQDQVDNTDDGAVVEKADDFAKELVLAGQAEPVQLRTDVVLPQIANTKMPVLLWNYDESLASNDGEYLAQSASELQTYYDLGMTYKFIESPMIRRQLKLADEEGILVQSASKDGVGYEFGFREGDLVLSIHEQPVDTQYDLVIAIDARRGKNTTARLKRSGSPQELAFTLQPVDESKQKRWIIGISVQEMDDILRTHLQTRGVIITTVNEDGPADKMGLLVHDIVTAVNDTEIGQTEDLRAAIQKSAGEDVTLKLIRNGGRMSVTLTPEEHSQPRDLSLNARIAQIPALSYTITPNIEFAQPQPLVISDFRKSDSKNAEESDFENSQLDQLLQQIDQLRQQVEALKKSK
jgi:membrane-associated protease RseP (regulator of RpoE activity)